MKLPLRSSALLITVSVLAGCAHKDPGVSRYGAYCTLLNPLIAKANREQVLRRFGMPSKKEEVAGVEVWQYLKNYGRKTASQTSSTATQAITLGIYDDVTIIFDPDGKLQSWKADIR